MRQTMKRAHEIKKGDKMTISMGCGKFQVKVISNETNGRKCAIKYLGVDNQEHTMNLSKMCLVEA